MRLKKLLLYSVLTLFAAGLVFSLTVLDNTSVRAQGFQNDTLQIDFQPALELVTDGFPQALYVTHAGDESNRLFVVEKAGRIGVIQNNARLPEYFLDIALLVKSDGYEQGLLGLAFHPSYEQNGHFFVYYTNTSAQHVVVRYTVRADNPNRADLSSAKQVLFMDDRYPNHNGGMIAFGPDGNLYIGTGDGGGAGDPLRAGQDTRTLLGKILRINVDNLPYTVPADNPFANGKTVNGKTGLPEIWSYGWRNPWRFSFDRATGDMYVGDVGQNAYEEISYEKAGTPGGQNYGWNVMEGFSCFRNRGCDTAGLVLPIAEYDHAKGISVTGGYVYRGAAFPRMQGTYFYADFGSTNMWALRQTAPGKWETAELTPAGFAVSSFGEDEAGEVYVVDFGGGAIYRLVDRG
jgi:glucose/arabinose dehydrogenase